jgi:hypothetical protein
MTFMTIKLRLHWVFLNDMQIAARNSMLAIVVQYVTGLLKFSLRVGYGSFFVFRCTLGTDKFDIIINIIGYVSIVLTDICRSFLRV